MPPVGTRNATRLHAPAPLHDMTTPAALLYTFREGDSNMRGVWICSRNDAIGNQVVTELKEQGFIELSLRAATLWRAFRLSSRFSG